MPTDHEALQGFWKPTARMRNGQPFKHTDLGTIFRFTSNRYLHIRSRVSYRFELHPDIMPKGIDFILVSTKGVARGIYELDGDRLCMRRNAWGKPPPTSFDDPDYPMEIYTRFKRRVPIKRRAKAQIPQTLISGGFIPQGLHVQQNHRAGQAVLRSAPGIRRQQWHPVDQSTSK
jgi:uncharacterized protein (TIGR03067 family)